MDYDDIVRDFVGCVVMYQDKPVYINEVSRDCKTVIYTDLLTQNLAREDLDIARFLKPIARIGYFNIGRYAFFAQRTPIRKFYMGLNPRNVSVQHIIETGDAERHKAQQLATKEVAEALLNHYPTLKQALKQCVELKGSCAFDKQFAVDYRMNVYYKTNPVGKVKDGNIEFKEEYKHLILLLDNNHAKDLRDFKAAII